MNRYLVLVKGHFMEYTVYSFSVFFTLIGNLFYIVLVFFLWKGIYGTSETIHGMTFNEVFVYLTLASSILVLFHNFTDWGMAYQIREGSIVNFLIKPVGYRLQLLCHAIGSALFTALLVTLPSLVVILLVFHSSIPLGINLIFFPISLACAFVLSFIVDYMIGITAFYTESIWGISTAKDVMVSLLSGALIPLQFFPESIQHVLQLLPFQAIYYIPLHIITGTGLQLLDYLQLIGIQLFWIGVLIIVSGLFYQKAIRVVTVNGG